MMAENCLSTSYKRKKCSDSEKCPTLRLLFWCIVIECFVGLPCVLSKCLGVDIGVATYPEGTINVQYGDPLEIFCVAEKYSSDDLEFMYLGKSLESERINDTTRRLYIEHPMKQLSSYYCRNNKSKKICLNRVLVDSPPANVTNFGCISRNLEHLNCSWNVPESYSVIKYNLTFVVNGKIVYPPCFVKRASNSYYCAWDTVSTPRYRQLDETLHLYMVFCNYFGCKNENFTIDHYSIVKPDPPMNLRVTTIGPHSVVLKWKIPYNMVEMPTCGIEHIIEYQIAKMDNTTYFHRVDSSSLPTKNYTYIFQLPNLPYAHMQYEVRIYIKLKKAVSHDFWSDFSYTVFYTASDRPQRPPDMIAGAFDQAIWGEKRIIYVYWKQIEEHEQAGADFTYKVLLMQGNKTFPIIYPDKSRSLSYVILRDISLEALDVTVWSVNENGSSVNSSQLYIPSEDNTHSLRITSFTKLSYENGTYKLSWVEINNVDNYTLFWCYQDTANICSGRMDFAVLDPKKNSHVIDLPREYKYQFAISANNGTRASGMVWARCDMTKDGFVMYRFPAELKYDAPGKSSVHLRWSMDCAFQDDIITGYNISYCLIVQTESYCDKSFENKYKYISDPKQMDVFIDGLLPFRTYQFTLSLNTTYGLKHIENATVVITTLEDTPTSPINVGIYDVKNDSLVISWDPPLQRNGNIGKYVIYNNEREYYVDKVSGTDVSRRQVTLTGLQGFTNYTFTVQACNIQIGLCSKQAPNVGLYVRTKIGTPGILKAPTFKFNPDMLKWEPPLMPGGPMQMYQIKRVRDDEKTEILNTSDLYYYLNFCEAAIETYQVRAVNLAEDFNYDAINTKNYYLGEWSPSSTIYCKRV